MCFRHMRMSAKVHRTEPGREISARVEVGTTISTRHVTGGTGGILRLEMTRKHNGRRWHGKRWWQSRERDGEKRKAAVRLEFTLFYSTRMRRPTWIRILIYSTSYQLFRTGTSERLEPLLTSQFLRTSMYPFPCYRESDRVAQLHTEPLPRSRGPSESSTDVSGRIRSF